MKREWKRLLGSRIFLGLLIGSMAVNAWVLINFGSQRELVKKSEKIWEELGLAVNENTAERYLRVLEPGEKEEKGIPNFRQIIEGTVYLTKNLNSRDMAEQFSCALMLEGQAREYAEKEYKKLDGILEENRENGKAEHFFVPGNRGFFELFSRWIPLVCTLESILAGILFMIYTVNEPLTSGTASVEYTTKRGRKCQDQRRRAAALTGVTFTVMIWGLTLLAAALMFPLGGLWKTPIGSMMVLDAYYPLISWFPLNIAEYVGVEFLLSVFAVLLFSYIGYGAAAKGRNSFRAFMLIGFGCACTYTVTSLFPKGSIFYFVLQYNPVDFARKAGHWMVNGASFLSPKYYEITVILVWGILTAGAAFVVRKQFLKKDL